MKRKFQIAVAIERASEYGRRFLQGVADFFDDKPDCQLALVNPSQVTDRTLDEYDGWICRITNKRILTKLHDTGKPVVDALCLTPFKGFSTIRTDYAAIGTLAAEHFLTHRFPNFGFCGYRHVTFSDLRRNAFVRVLEDRGFRPSIYRPPYLSNRIRSTRTQQLGLTEGPLGEAEDAGCLADWLRRLPKPVAIFCCDDFRASAVARLCKRAGISIPDEVAILGVDNDPVYCMFGSPRISSIDPNAEALGFAAAEMLHGQLSSRRSRKPLSRTIPPKGIVVRASTDAYPNAPAWFADTLSYIENETHSGLSASDVFRRVGYSRTLVERVFRQVLGMTVQEKIAETRIDAARRLLTSTALPIKDVAARTGYRSVAYFTRTFGAATGQSPADYRRRSSAARRAGHETASMLLVSPNTISRSPGSMTSLA